LSQQPYPEDDLPAAAGSQLSYRDYIIREMVDTERKYVQDLENLHDLKKALEQRLVVPGDTIHQIFMNINAILDFQRRFLIRVETTNSMPQQVQQWGSPFVTFEGSFDIYQPFIANQRKAAQTAQAVFDKIKTAHHPVAEDFNTLDGFLLKPMQRLVKYPLLLKDLMKKSEDPAIKADLAAGIAAAERVLSKANEAVDRDLLDEALDDLVSRVDDWKNHKVEQFGKLLLHGVYTVVTGKSDQEKDYEIYLFECILLCCKEVMPNKSKDKKDKTKSTGPKVRNKNARLQLKGRIFMTNVTEVLSFAKPGKVLMDDGDWMENTNPKLGSYTVQIWWKGDPGVENFVIRFQNEDIMKKWATGLDTQRKYSAPQSTTSPDQPPPDFAWMQTQTAGLVNPYAQQEEEEEEEYQPTGVNSQYGAPQPSMMGTLPRNSSSSSLRARSATGESQQSLASIVRAPPPRYPLPQPPVPLTLQTQMTGPPAQGIPSPGPRGGDSYFSPVAESPVSSRTSTTSGIFPPSAGYAFPKTGTPQPGGWEGDSNRYTAPAMPRAPSRDGAPPANAYGMVVNGVRNPRGPSLPVMSQNSQTLSQQQRSRSYSTPDINGQPARRTPGGSQGHIPAVPGIPPHLHPAHERHDLTIPRSQTGSPMQDLPIRANTQSPGAQRERLQRQGIPYGGTMAQFPAQPIYPRQSTPGPTSNPGPGLMPAPLNLAADGMAMSQVPGQLSAGMPAPGANSILSPDMPLPTQLKVKVNYDKTNYMTLVAAYNITYEMLVGRIDAKLSRFTNSSIGGGNLKLRYMDEDGDFVSIESDDDIQIAFMEWRDGVRNMYNAGVGEIELYCVSASAI
jgi:cell division control protein 24